MTLLDWIWTTWRKAMSAREGQTAVASIERPTSRVPAEYLSLYTYLERRYASNVVLTFEQMEALLGFALPESARTERDWWTSPVLCVDRHSDAWTGARRTATPNFSAQTVAFERLP